MTFYSGAYLSIFSVVIFDQRRLLVIMRLNSKVLSGTFWHRFRNDGGD